MRLICLFFVCLHSMNVYCGEVLFAIQRDSIVPLVCEAPSVSNEPLGFPYLVVDEKPTFAACKEVPQNKQFECFKEQLDKHIRQNMFELLKENAYACTPIQGRVNIIFRINSDGSITVTKVRGSDEYLEAKAREFIEKLPRLIPAKHRGKVVPVYFAYPVLFRYNF